MANEKYGATQVREIELNRSDVEKAVMLYIEKHHGQPYDFDYDKPIFIWPGNIPCLKVRFIQREITQEKQLDQKKLRAWIERLEETR